MQKETLRSKFSGSLIGTAVGDGLGASPEGWCMIDPAKQEPGNSQEASIQHNKTSLEGY